MCQSAPFPTADELHPISPQNATTKFAAEKKPDSDVSTPLVSTPQSRHTPSLPFGYTLMLFAGIGQALRNFLFHVAEIRLSIPPCTAFTTACAIFTLCSLTFIVYFRMLSHLRMPLRTALRLFVRGLLTALTVYLNDLALLRTPVGLVMTILSTIPAITSILSAIFLGDSFSLMDGFILVLNMVGVALVSQPSATGGDTGAIYGILLTLLAAFCGSVSFVLVKAMGDRVHYSLNTLSIGLGGLLISPFVTRLDDMAALLQYHQGALVTFCGGLTGFVSQGLMSRGVQICRPGPALVVRTLNVPVAFALGLVFLDERISFIGIVGVCIVLACVGYIGFSSFLKQRAREAVAFPADSAVKAKVGDGKV